MTTSMSLENLQTNQSTNQRNEKARSHPHLQSVPLIPDRYSSPLQVVVTDGRFQVHTAPYRGSFSGVLCESLRSAGLGSRVMIAQFLKGGVQQGPRNVIRLCGGLEWLRPDLEICLEEPLKEKKSDQDETNFDTELIAVKEVWQACRAKLLENTIDQLVLDELGLAIAWGYLDEKEVISTLEQRPATIDVIVTGPSIPTPLMSMADQVTELRSGF